MPKRLQILLIDDNPDDRTLVARELQRAFPGFHPLHITDLAGFKSTLETGGFDLVITDYQLPWTDGLTVLREVKSRWPQCPVVMFTGTGSEEIAVEAMKAGLSDYVLKAPRQYVRLAGAVQRALQMAEQDKELRNAETRFSRLFDTVPVGLYRATPSGRLLDANPAFVNILGYRDKKTLLEIRLRELHANPRDYDTWWAMIERDKAAMRYETEWRRRDGSTCWVENNAHLIHPASGDRMDFEGSVEDITQRKEAENERERLILELQNALAQIQTLGGLLPICSSCKKIRDERGNWTHIESYIQSHSEAEFTHSFCPDCVQSLYPDLAPQVMKTK